MAGRPNVGSVVMHARQCHLLAGRIHHHELAVPDLAVAGVHLLDLDDVAVGVELDVVEDANRRHDKAHFGGQRAAQRLDLLGEPVAAAGGVDQRQQRIAELDFQIVHLQRRRHRLFRRRRFLGLGFLGVVGRGRLLAAAVDHIGEACRAAAERKKRNHRNAGQQRHHHHDGCRHAERFRIAGKLAEQRLVGGAGNAGLETTIPSSVTNPIFTAFFSLLAQIWLRYPPRRFGSSASGGRRRTQVP